MKIVYKALASIGMLALSTAAAMGVRHLVKKQKKSDPATSENKNGQTDKDTPVDFDLEPETESKEENAPQNETESSAPVQDDVPQA